MPRNVAWFEQLFYASLVVRLTTAIVDFGRLSKVASAFSLIGASIAGLALLSALVWLIARRGKNWARWVLLAVYLLGLPLVILGPFVSEVGGVRLERPSLFVVSLIMLEAMAQAAAFVFVFTGDARTWFAPAPQDEFPEIEMPRAIARFEFLAYLGLLLSVVITPFDWAAATRMAPGPSTALTGAKIAAAAGLLLGIVAMGVLVWLVARRRKDWARWLFVVFYVAGLAYFIFVTLGRAGRLIDALSVLQAALWGIALYFAFARDARAWFQPVPGAPPMRSVRPKPRFRVPAGRRVVVAPGELNHPETVDAYIAEMAQLGVGTYTAAPPFFRMFWGMGLRIPPPLFMGYVPLLLTTGSIFAVFWSVGMWLMIWRSGADLPAWLVLPVAAVAGLLFGLVMAGYYRWRSESLALPSWENYLPPR